MTINKALINNWLKKIWLTAAILIILAAVFSSLFRSLTPWAKQYKSEVEHHLTQLIGQPVLIHTMQTGWYWFHPVLKLEHSTIKGKQSSIHIEKLFVGINLWSSLIHWRIQPGLLYLKNVHLVVRKKNNGWTLDGIDTTMDTHASLEETIKQLIALLSQQDRLIIKELSLDLHLNDKKWIPIKDCQLLMVNRNGQYKVNGAASIDQKERTLFKLLAELDFDPEHLNETRGQIYFSVKQFVLPQWQALVPTLPQYIKNGLGDLDLWLDLKRGVVSSIQAQLSLKDLSWLDKKHSTAIPSFYANMSWKPNRTGWEFNADQVQVELGKEKWPENKILVQFDATQQSYLIFVKTILVDSLLKQMSYYKPELIQPLISLKPVGILRDFQLALKNNQPSYLLTRFEQLSWSAKNNVTVHTAASYTSGEPSDTHSDSGHEQLQYNIPGITNLSGAIQWAPQEGHLEIDSTNTSLSFKSYPKQTLDLLNGVIDWKELNNGLRVSVDRLVFSQPELTVSMRGTADEVGKDSLGAIRLDLDFSAKNIQQWMPYLPKQQMKIKLFNWLNKDIKRITEATGKVKINGLAKEFPFDNNNGEFSITSHLLGVDLLITPKWPLIKELEGYIRLKNRNLDIDVVHGNAQGVPLEQMHLRIDDIGNDKETLLVHSIIKGAAQKMLNFVLASPLHDKLSKLKILAIKGTLLLDLNLEIPLYPENDDDLAKGLLTFADNTIQINHELVSIPIEEIKGTLSFDESGVTQSVLEGTAFAYPLAIKIESKSTPEPMTLISVVGECTIESLRSKFNYPIFSILKGIFSFNALLQITANPNDLDHIVVQSSLEGLAINLPEPLGKKLKGKADLQTNIEFNTEKAFRIRGTYNNKLSTDLVFAKNDKKEFAFKSGQIGLGVNPAVAQTAPGLSIVGSLDGFNLAAWNKVMTRFSAEPSDSFVLSHLTSFNLQLNKFVFLHQSFNNLAIKGNILPTQDWNFNIAQQNISADLSYHRTTHLLSGFVHHLALEKIKLAKKEDSSSSQVKPDQIPNLNLRIDNFSLGKTSIGNMTIKSHSDAEQWTIDYCRIDTPAYQLLIDGNWQQKNNLNHTNLQFKLHFNNLAKSLELWDLTPAVDATKGDLIFNGGWNDSIYDFSLAGLNGTMYLQLNNGRITHLSPETEEKLGLGKLLSILSLQTIPRRLKLDFSDLSQEGYSFDIFKGNFNVGKGIITTQDSYLDGPVAYASMQGNLDIVRRMYDLNLKISPHITASLPVVATIAGGPIAGLAAWVANKIINQSMQKIIAYSYKISGPWNDPVVQQLSIVKKKIKKN